MTNLDSILKSRDITLPTKFHLVKAIVFPSVMYGCEIWTIKNAEGQRIDALNWDGGEDCKSPLDCKEIHPVHPKEISPCYSLDGLLLKLKLQYFGHLMGRADALEKDPDAGKEWKQEDKGTTEDEMVEWHHRVNGHKFR